MSNLTWPTERMARLIDVSPRRLQQLVQEGVVPKCEGRGRYNPLAVTQAYIRFLRDRVQSPELSDSEFFNAKLNKIRSEHEMIKTQTKLLDSKLAEQNGDLIFAWELANFVQSIWAVLRSEIDSWHLKEAARRQLGQRLHEVCLAAAKVCGVDTTEAEGKLKADIEKFKEELAAGHVPDFWFDPYEPENNRRVWSQELGRYYSKAEIIAKFGEGGQWSPIDEILDDAGVMPVACENRTEAQKSGLTK